MLYVPLRNGRMYYQAASLKEAEGEAIRIEVPVRILDDYALDNVSVIKMDVEGREIPALEGGARMIRRWRPTLLIEIDQAHHSEPIPDVLAQIHQIIGNGYTASYLDREGKLRPVRGDCARNFFFLPNEISGAH